LQNGLGGVGIVVDGQAAERAAAVVSETIESVLSASSLVEHVRLVFFNEADARTFLKHQKFSTTG